MSKKRRDIPAFGLPIIETHFHLDYLKDASVGDILQQARDIGVERFMTIAVAPENMETVIKLTEEHSDVFGTLGVHPHDAEKYQPSTGAFIRANCGMDKIVAVGEIGLDYFYDNSDRAVQRTVFAEQLQIAVDTGLPVVIHTREADADTMAILREYAPQMKNKGVVHSFTSGMELAEVAVELGFCLGINGIVTFNKADNVREVVAATPMNQLLLETDSPFLTPVPYRGTENAPKYLPFIAEKIADVKGIDVEEVLRASYDNSLRTFFN
ncbi:MAG: TatD family hydrolase [Thalassolituus sp.]|uniref:TatD family hydrolase n=1 Tax=Thalassolituus sp. UBA3500 TaxID=1947664 RepID=UPI000C0D57E6|nr:TatD family hydrolase [Thalassolituus sp. UBA3500]MBN57607.1 hydrolase TatD [Oceanospirillaceae bacterium]MDQ4423020.1 TatD family hydrolase [Thalassolituus sp.]|tara:strand:- start:26490 stop:27293 length:804 start_codon:yes stop_codon:yes gene_type:complete